MIYTLISLAGPALIASFTCAILIYLTKGLHGRFTFDGSEGIQKIHKTPTPRVGGIAVAVGIATGLVCLPHGTEIRSIGLGLLLASGPAFAVGLYEDLTKTVSPRTRLLSHLLSALILVVTSGYVLRHTGFQPTDVLMRFTPFAVLISVFAVAGMTNAVNIIDGYNGLASGSCIIMSAGIALIAVRLGDTQIFMFATIFAFSIMGFMLVNFPHGKIFLGDGGAYLCGFLLCALVLILTARHPGLSPWVPLLIIIYPVWETLITILRRIKRKGHSPGSPDRVHLHNLVGRSVARDLSHRIGWQQGKNPLTAVAIWPFPILTVLIALNTEMSSANALLGIIIFQGFYGRIYRKLTLSRY